MLTVMFLTGGSPNRIASMTSNPDRNIDALLPNQGTLVYEPGNLTLINTGESPLDIGLLIFVRDSDQSDSSPSTPSKTSGNSSNLPVSFEARLWDSPLLLPGECVQLVADAAASQPAPIPEFCHKLLKWQSDSPNATHFWQASPTIDRFRVVIGSLDAQTCDVSAGRCVFSFDEVLPMDSLTMTYSATTFRLINDGTNAVSLQRLLLCSEPLCNKPLAWQPTGFKGVLAAGGCIDLNANLVGGSSPATPDCIGLQIVGSAFWRSAFVVISPITAHLTNCPAALPKGLQRCVVPR
ncbi:MAG: hypothetical protein ABI947_14905 [Chloroflexota bacterium]